MQNKSTRILGLVLAVIIIGGMVSSCKTHEVCPAYTKIEKTQDNA